MNPAEEVRYNLTWYGEDAEMERVIVETLLRLPEDVRRFASEECLFVSVGGGAHGTANPLHFPEARDLWLIALSEVGPSDSLHSVVAHEIAHAWLGHRGQGAEEDEAAAYKQAQAWGFTGIGADAANDPRLR